MQHADLIPYSRAELQTPESGADERHELISLGLMYTLFQLSGPEFMASGTVVRGM